MKKSGFTLVEILVVILILGCVLALTLPTFVTSNQNRAFAAKLSSNVSAFENAFATYLVNSGSENLDELNNINGVEDYIKITVDEGGGLISDFYDSENPFTNIDETQAAGFGVTRIWRTKDGALIMFAEDMSNTLEAQTREDNGLPFTSMLGYFRIDVNGSAGPNRHGRDLFKFYLVSNGTLIPAGSPMFRILERTMNNDVGIWTDDEGALACSDAFIGTGEGCTARLVQNGYKVDY